MRFCRCLTWSGPLNFSSVSKPSRPLALLPIGRLCQAESCSIFTQVAQAFENPHLSKPPALSFLAASNTSGQVLGTATPALSSASLLYHITVEDELNGKDSISPFDVE